MAGKAVPRFKNVSPLGALDVPALGRVIAESEEFEVREDLAHMFAAQMETFEAVNASAKTIEGEALNTLAADGAGDGEPAKAGEQEEVTEQ